MNPAFETLTSLRALVAAGEITPVEVIEGLAREIEAAEHPQSGYLSWDVEAALADAASADPGSPLAGLPIAVKDLINVRGQPCGCASRLLDGAYTSPYDAGSIERLRAAGGVPFGRTNMDEFAMGSSTENSAAGPTLNPWDRTRVPGGSSGGSAAVVAGDLALAALGSDTGGSIRQPASFCGCVGLKPTYGAVSRYGLVAFASSLDQIGPMTKTVDDAALLFDAIRGPDSRDSTSLPNSGADGPGSPLTGEVRGWKLGIPSEYVGEGVEPEVRACLEAAVGIYEAAGVEVREVSLPHTRHAVAVYYIIATAEASANLARFDGVRYGNREGEEEGLLAMYRATRSAGFGPEVKRRILLGTHVLSSGYYDAYYITAQKVRSLIRRDFEQAFEQVDALLTPVSPTPAFALGSYEADPLQMYLADVCTLPANLAGICGLSVPAGFVPAEEGRLPVGIQLLGGALEERRLLELGKAFENATDFHRQRPRTAAG